MSDVRSIVETSDSRPAGPSGACFYCRSSIGANHKEDCVILALRRYDALEPWVWYPISAYEDGTLAVFWLPHGERGVGGIESGIAYRDDDGIIRSGWTHGGPNAGSDFDFCEPPSMFCKPLNPTIDASRD